MKEKTRQGKDELARLVRTLKKIPAEEMDIRENPHKIEYLNELGAVLSVQIRSGTDRYDGNEIYLGNDVYYTVRIKDEKGELLIEKEYCHRPDILQTYTLGEEICDILEDKKHEADETKKKRAEQSIEGRAVSKILGGRK